VRFSVVNMPLVRTPMTAPTKLYEKLPLISPEEAADIVCDAIIHQPKRLATKLGIFAQLMSFIAPKITEIILSQAYRMFPESAAARGALPAPAAEPATARASVPPVAPATSSREDDGHASEEMVVFATLLRGIHW
jgi:hypothetical protein